MNSRRDTTRLTLILAFALVISLMAGVVAYAVRHIDAAQKQLNLITEDHFVKFDLASHMRRLARERMLVLHRLILIDDAFELDEQWLYFNQLAAEFAADRSRFLQLDLNPQEKLVLQTQGKLTADTVIAQNRVAELALEGKTAEAKRLLLDEALPMQNAVFIEIKKLYDLQEHYIDQAATEAAAAHASTKRVTYLFSAIALLISIVIASVGIRVIAGSERRLVREKLRATTTLHAIGDGVITTSARGLVDYINPVAEQLTGWGQLQAFNQPLLSVLRLVDDATGDPLVSDHHQLVSSQQPPEANRQSMLLTAGFKVLPIEFTATPLHDDNGELNGLVVVFRDVSETRALTKQLSYQARHDPLTGLVNRREFESRLQTAIENARGERLKHVVCFLDLDRFKIINDQCGHAAGDELLRQLAATLKQQIRSNDLLARIGGDEFGLLLENCPLGNAVAIADEIRGVIEEFDFVWEGARFQIGVSIGLVVVDDRANDVASITALADAACYTAKHEGRNRIHVYDDDEISAQDGAIQPWINRLQRALDFDSFTLYCQPIVPVNKSVQFDNYCELHLRYVDDKGQPHAPLSFLPIAERHHLLSEIDAWVLRRTCAMIADSADQNTVCCINQSAQALLEDNYTSKAFSIANAAKIAPQRICLEIAEGQLQTNRQALSGVLKQLKEIGFRIALDDGGHSALLHEHLNEIPFDLVKIDGQLTGGIASSPVSAVQIKAICEIAHLLSMKVVAEQVEDHGTVAKLKKAGVDFVQGYGIAKPRPVDEVLGDGTGARMFEF